MKWALEDKECFSGRRKGSRIDSRGTSYHVIHQWDSELWPETSATRELSCLRPALGVSQLLVVSLTDLYIGMAEFYLYGELGSSCNLYLPSFSQSLYNF